MVEGVLGVGDRRSGMYKGVKCKRALLLRFMGLMCFLFCYGMIGVGVWILSSLVTVSANSGRPPWLNAATVNMVNAVNIMGKTMLRCLIPSMLRDVR